MTFAEELRIYVDELGTAKVARACGVTTRSIQLWQLKLSLPNMATRTGALVLLAREYPTIEEKVIAKRRETDDAGLSQ